MEELRLILSGTYSILKKHLKNIPKENQELRERLSSILIEINSLEYEIRTKDRAKQDESNSDK